MKKVFLISTLVLLVLVLAGAWMARSRLEDFYEAPRFRDLLHEVLDQAVKGIIPEGRVSLGKVTADGLGFRLDGIAVVAREEALLVPTSKVHVEPSLFPSLFLGRIRVEVGLTGLDKTENFRAEILAELAPFAEGKARIASFRGNFQDLDAAAPVITLFGRTEGTVVDLKGGRIDGRFEAPGGLLGPKDIDLTLRDLALDADVMSRIVSMRFVPTTLSGRIEGRRLTLRDELKLSSAHGHLRLTKGSILFSAAKGQNIIFDLDAVTAGSRPWQVIVPHLFRCRRPPQKDHFRIKGPLVAVNCG